MPTHQEPPRTDEEAIVRALKWAEYATQYRVAGENIHHKQWIIDQMVRCLTGPSRSYLHFIERNIGWEVGTPFPPFDD